MHPVLTLSTDEASVVHIKSGHSPQAMSLLHISVALITLEGLGGQTWRARVDSEIPEGHWGHSTTLLGHLILTIPEILTMVHAHTHTHTHTTKLKS